MNSRQVRRWLLLLLCVLGVLTLAAAASNSSGQHQRQGGLPLAYQGELDLSDWRWAEDGTVSLDGQWEFYWRQLLTPENLKDHDSVTATGWISVPGPWNGYQVEDQALPGTGYATYRLRVILPDEEQRLAIHIPYESTAYRLYANGRLVAANGNVGADPEHSMPQYHPITTSVQPDGRLLELVMQVSNFHHRRGGLWNNVLLGAEHEVVQNDTRRVAGQSVLFGVLLAAGLYHLLIFRLRTNAVSNLYFGLLILVMAVKTAATGQLLLVRLIPQFPWSGLLTAEYLTFSLGLPLFFLFLRSLYPHEVTPTLTRTAIWVGMLLSARNVLLPTMLTSRSIGIDQISSVFFGLCALVIIGRAVRNGRDHAGLFLGSCAVWLTTIINDILYTMQAPSAGLILSPAGILSFVIGMTLILAQQYTGAFRRQAELAAYNTELAAKLRQNLHELWEARRILASQDEQVRKQIAEALHGRVQNKLFLAQLQLTRAKEMLHADPDSSAAELTEVEARLTLLREEEIRGLSHLLHPAIISIGLIPAIEALAEEYNGLLKVDLRVDPDLAHLDDPKQGLIPESVRLTVYRVLAEALQNTLAHAAANTVTIELAYSDSDEITVRVQDDGSGFDPVQVKKGLGLQTIGARITEGGGSWELQSAVGEGTTLTFSVPSKLPAHSSGRPIPR